MAETKTTTTVDYPVKEFMSLVKDQMFAGKDVRIEFVIAEVGCDPFDRFPGRQEVARVKVSFDGVPPVGLDLR